MTNLLPSQDTSTSRKDDFPCFPFSKENLISFWLAACANFVIKVVLVSAFPCYPVICEFSINLPGRKKNQTIVSEGKVECHLACKFSMKKAKLCLMHIGKG